MLKCILFDLDGTLVNSLTVTFNGFNHAFQKFGGKFHSPEEIMAHFGPGEREIFGKVLGDKYGEPARDAYFEYTRGRLHEAPLFPGISEILDECRERGLKLGIVTGRGRESTQFILEHLGISDRFGCILTHDDLSSSKPSPEGILRALEILDEKPENAVYVGDMWMDIRAARRAGCRALSAGWDIMHNIALVEAEVPDAWFATPSDFLSYLAAGMRGYSPKKGPIRL